MQKQLKLIYLVTILCLFVFAFSTNSIANQRDGLLKVYFLDVGQGDAIFIEAPNGNQVLIDGGPDNKVLSELGKVMPFYDHNIDLVILTHPHADHLAGLIEVLERYEVENIVEAKEGYNSPAFLAWKEIEKKERANEIEATAGRSIHLGEEIVLNILYPFQSLAGQTVKNPNNSSVVLMLEHKNIRILLTGDIEASVENRLIASDVNLSADILKVSHHGSRTSSTEKFLQDVQPQTAFIEVGRNGYGHPSPEILERLESLGVKYYRSDIDGTKKLISDGEKFMVQ